MNNRQAYDKWSETYDSGQNKTRDLEAAALRESIKIIEQAEILEIGCGTGKNTEWLASRAKRLIGADFSPKMLARAKKKIKSETVEFCQLDLREKWNFKENQFDLVTCSLALEHIENIDFVFRQALRVLRPAGLFYIGELHPFKQYQGSKAKFEKGTKIFELECFAHHISEFFRAAKDNNFECVDLKEWFDDETNVPRILTMIFKAKK